MPEKPVAKLALDTRAHGPYFCQKCDAENEDALLMSDASVVCPECKEPMPEFQPFTDVIVSASPVSGGKGTKKERWVIEWTGPDTSRDDITRAFDSREEALKTGAEWAKDEAHEALEDTESPEALEMLEAVTDAASDLDAVQAWLDYQAEYDPSEQMAIGPSGYVTKHSHELS